MGRDDWNSLCYHCRLPVFIEDDRQVVAGNKYHAICSMSPAVVAVREKNQREADLGRNEAIMWAILFVLGAVVLLKQCA
jgi:hypothetical protein